jgi:hypothetical protein
MLRMSGATTPLLRASARLGVKYRNNVVLTPDNRPDNTVRYAGSFQILSFLVLRLPDFNS